MTSRWRPLYSGFHKNIHVGLHTTTDGACDAFPKPRENWQPKRSSRGFWGSDFAVFKNFETSKKCARIQVRGSPSMPSAIRSALCRMSMFHLHHVVRSQQRRVRCVECNSESVRPSSRFANCDVSWLLRIQEPFLLPGACSRGQNDKGH